MLALALQAHPAKSQQIYADERTTGYGIGLIYNFMTEGLGV